HCALVERLWRDWSPGWRLPPADMAKIRALFASPRVADAALSYYRCAFGAAARTGAHMDLQRRIGIEAIRVPCLYLHGDQDGCIDYSAGANMHELFVNGLDRRRVEGAGHFLHLERPDEINGTIAAYLTDR